MGNTTILIIVGIHAGAIRGFEARGLMVAASFGMSYSMQPSVSIFLFVI
jgi:hypothetical protein